MDVEFGKFYNTYYMQVYSFILTQVKNRDLAEETTQKTFFRAMQTSASFRGDSSEFTWLCSIAKNLLADEYRVQKRSARIASEALPQSDPEDALVDADSILRIHQVLHELEEPYKEVFQLRVFGELSFKKIGLVFKKTENWARVTYHRARLKIQERMDEK